MLGSETVASASVNPVKPSSTVPSRLAQWLQSASADVWVKFLLALVGLGLAFGAALFSTVSRDAGNVWATVILASTSLVLATLVGLVTVPYLARRVAVERLRETFDYDVTRAGIVYALVTLVIGIAALNTGNNLLYIIVAAMLAAILVSGVVSAWVLRWLELDVRLPEHLFAGRAVHGRIVLRNPRKYLPSFSIRVVSTRKKRKKAMKQWQWEATTFSFPFNRPADQQWLRLPDRRLRRVTVLPPPPGIFQGMAYFPFIPPQAELSADLALKFDQRGRYREDSFGLATRFPFAFLTKTRHVSLPREVLVYPRIEPTESIAEILPRVRGEWESFVRGRGADLYRIREYMHGGFGAARRLESDGKIWFAESSRVCARRRAQGLHRLRQSGTGADFRARLRKGSRSGCFDGLAFFHAGSGGFLRCPGSASHTRSARISGLAGGD